MNVLRLEECTAELSSSVGGKAVGLGRLLRAGVRVPPGFVITTHAYRMAIAGMRDRINQLLENTGSSELDQIAAARIQDLFVTQIPEALAKEIDAAYWDLCQQQDRPVAVRSSATAEDTQAASFAGQQDTYLWIVGEEAVRRHVVRCWASLFTARAITYRARVGINCDDLAMGVVVQEMVPAESAGVMMTLEPVRGDRSQIYIESAYGLGEIVVRGEVEPDRFWLNKNPLTLRTESIATKDRNYRFDPASREVRLMEVPVRMQTERSLSSDETIQLGLLGLAVEKDFGCPVDIEWAIALDPTTGRREVYALQARPETVWTSKPSADDDVRNRHDDWDPMQTYSEPHINWTTTNAGEAAPGVLTPLCASVWVHSGENTQRQGAYRVGLMTRKETIPPADRGQWFLGVFYGRFAIQVQAWALLGDRIPGTSGAAAVQSLFGRIPPGLEFHPTRRFYLSYAIRASLHFISLPRRLKAVTKDWDSWWTRCVQRVATLDEAQAVRMFVEGRTRMLDAQIWTSITVMAAIQPLFDIMRRLVEGAGGDLSSLSSISGNPEMALVSDLWKVSRGQMKIEGFVARHGFHGPGEGELSSRVWRDDDAPLRRMAKQYAKLDDSQNPGRIEAERLKQRDALESRILSSVPRWRRPFVRMLFNAAAERLALRGVGKRSYLQGIDVMRISARRIGELKVARGELNEIEDVFYLTAGELEQPLLSDVKDLVARRRARRKAYQELTIPQEWTGMPQAKPIGAVDVADVSAGDIQGVGVSAGVVEGRARVVLNPDFADVQPNEILIAPTTDPSWSSIMFISAAVVVDIGGALSHAAVVAREMEIPCIVNTRNATKLIKTGDRVRVDGTAGTIHVLERAVN